MRSTPDAIVFGCFGGLTPEKRIPQILDAFAATRAYVPSAHLLLAGGQAAHYDVRGDAERRGLIEHATLTGYIDSDEELDRARRGVRRRRSTCDGRPRARSRARGSDCLAAGMPTVIVDLAHLADVPSIDPRTWQPNGERAARRGRSP